MAKETEASTLPGAAIVLAMLVFLGTDAELFYLATHDQPLLAVAALIVLLLLAFGLNGFLIVNPNEAKVLQLFGSYEGSVKTPGLRWANPLFAKRAVSQRAATFQSEHLKVNDTDGNPIEIAAIIVWRVVDTARAIFDVNNCADYVRVQSEAALRNLATSYPYDSHEADKLSLRGNTAVIAEHLKKEVQEKAAVAGVQIVDARISHLAYAPEIAQAMLQRQQAGAIIAARRLIVEGAVGMVELALERLSKNHVVELDEERKAAMVSNLLVVLCGERATQPVVNTGTIYQ
jgi:regulator of protease activity HflC (stomatin/prohibitin superfamily)